LGQATPALSTRNVFVCETLDEAFAWSFARSERGDAILLSPACASFDQFRDYAHRAARFCELITALDRARQSQTRADESEVRDRTGKLTCK
jgi:UDP-N-acetylmuramoylalanine--D-glutamate ligase